MELQRAVFRSCSMCRTLQHGSSSKHRDGRMLSHYSNIYTGYRFNSGSTTSWPCKVRSTGTPSYLSHNIKPRTSTRHLRSSSQLLLQKPTTRTHYADRAFRCTAPTVWNSLNSYSVDSGLLAVFKSRLKTFLFRRTFNPV